MLLCESIAIIKFPITWLHRIPRKFIDKRMNFEYFIIFTLKSFDVSLNFLWSDTKCKFSRDAGGHWNVWLHCASQNPRDFQSNVETFKCALLYRAGFKLAYFRILSLWPAIKVKYLTISSIRNPMLLFNCEHFSWRLLCFVYFWIIQR